MIFIQHNQTGLYYNFRGAQPHVALQDAAAWDSVEQAAKAVTFINQAGRGSYSVVEVAPAARIEAICGRAA